MNVLIKLLLAHLLGDFLFQPKSWIQAKESKKLKSYQLYLHSLGHGVLAFFLVWEWRFWKWALAIVVLHFIIDSIKVTAQTEGTKRVYFFIDQSLHFGFIYFIWLLSQRAVFPLAALTGFHALLLVTALFFLTRPVSIAVKHFISRWSPQTEDTASDSLQSAGMYIGIIERLFVFWFVIADQWEAIGFLIAAKSIFRFGDLKEAKDRKLTEYILIGTLASFGIAIVAALVYLRLSKIR